jgi:hypothetical protein
MATFPKLKTNAVAQYPATRALQFQNEAMRFLDGVEQRYRDAGTALHCWTIRLDQLDEGELAEVDVFFGGNLGRFGSFTFVDPWDGASYPNCSLTGDQLDLTSLGQMRGQTSLTVTENRT